MAVSISIIIAIVGGGIVFFCIAYILSLKYVHRWKKNYDKKQEQKEREAEEKRRWENCRVTPDNPFLCEITKKRLIMIDGAAGNGKTTAMDMLLHWLNTKRLISLQNNARYYSYMHTEFLEKVKERLDNNLIPFVASNFDIVDKDGLRNDDIMPYLVQDYRAIEGMVLGLDETASELGKNLYHEGQKDEKLKEMLAKIKKFGEYIRHYINGYLIVSDQAGSDLYVGLRQMSFAEVHALQTVVRVLPRGKFLRKIKQNTLKYLPAFWTSLRTCVTMQLTRKQRVLTVLKSLFVPLYWLLPREYYKRAIKINKDIKEKYTEFRMLLSYNGWYQWLIFGNESLFKFESRYKKKEYEEQFDKNGKRKDIANEPTESPAKA